MIYMVCVNYVKEFDMKLNLAKPVKMMMLTAAVSGAALVGGGAVIRNNRAYEDSQKRACTDYSPMIEMLDEIQKSSAVGRQIDSIMKEHEKSYFKAIKEERRMERDDRIESEKNRDLSKATNDIERAAIKAYALTRLTTNHISNKLEDSFGN